MARQRSSFVCGECGAEFPRWSGRCPNCREWDTLAEQSCEPKRAGPGASDAGVSVSLSQITAEFQARIGTGLPEFDRVLGGGVLPGSVVLLGGEPGIGKSTLLLQALGKLAHGGAACLYVSCEESLDQIKMRAERLGLGDAPLNVSPDTDLEGVLSLLRRAEPAVVAVDSIQRLSLADLDSPAGSLKQVSLCATALTEACKRQGCALFLVGHVTKQGYIAGPRALEHLVDTVLYFESEKFQTLRILRAAKNRFGAVNEIGVFQMAEHGLREVPNPSELFLSERDADSSGSVVAPVMEGSRALLVEIQALVGPAAYGTAERKVSGVDYRRFSMMLSVLERKSALEIGGCDAFVNVAGGVRVDEPAADLPLVLALASSFMDRPFCAEAVAVGEVGLGGEVRTVGRLGDRLREAAKLGFTRALVPPAGVEPARRAGLEPHAARHLSDALGALRSM